jgi:hypothetical protein
MALNHRIRCVAENLFVLFLFQASRKVKRTRERLSLCAIFVGAEGVYLSRPRVLRRAGSGSLTRVAIAS